MAEQTTTTTENKTTTTAPDPAKELADLKAERDALAKKVTDYEAGNKDLLDKVRDKREETDKKSGDTKTLENALRFSMGSKDWLKTNESLLPKDIADLFTAAEKERYESAVEKASALKSGIVQSFFSIQANADLLTPTLKTSLDDYLKLTKTGKQEKASAIYDTVFEPAFEMLKRVKKAESLKKENGYGSEDDWEVAYRDKLQKSSAKLYLGEK